MVDFAIRSLSCCCLDNSSSDAHQITTYPGENPFLDEHGSQPLQLPPPGFAPQTGRLSPIGGLGESDLGIVSARSASSARSAREGLSAEERQKEKERLQDMVKEFAKAAVQGQPCQWLPAPGATGQPIPATYAFDKGLRHFIVRPEDSSPLQLEMARIADVVKDVRGTPFGSVPRLPPPHALSGDELDRRFVYLQGLPPEGPNGIEYVALLLPNPYERERFFTSMKILRWASESRRRS